MSASCSIDKKRLEYQTLKQMSGLSDFQLDTYVSNYYNENQRFPELDEIPKVDSTKHLNTTLNIKKSKNFDYTDTKTILQNTNTDSLEKAVPIINNKYRDLEVSVSQINEQSIVKIQKRPSKYNITKPTGKEVDTNFDLNKSKAILNKTVEKLNNLYGTEFVVVSSQELPDVPNAAISKAFVYDGKIYINSDLATIDSPVHEMLHLFLGSMRFTDPEFYYNMVSLTQEFPSLNSRISLYPNRTQLDIMEELFVEEFAKFLTGQDSHISKIPKSIINKCIYNINRTLDSVLMGNFSVQSHNQKAIINSNLLQLAESTESDIMNGNIMYFNDLSKISRQVSNLKSKLLESGELIENCL